MIEEFVSSGHIADLVLVVMALEALVLFVLRQRGILILPFRAYIFGILAGGFIILALRLALTGGGIMLMALALAFSFAAHIAEIFYLVHRNNTDPNHIDPSYKLRSNNGTASKKGLQQ